MPFSWITSLHVDAFHLVEEKLMLTPWCLWDGRCDVIRIIWITPKPTTQISDRRCDGNNLKCNFKDWRTPRRMKWTLTFHFCSSETLILLTLLIIHWLDLEAPYSGENESNIRKAELWHLLRDNRPHQTQCAGLWTSWKLLQMHQDGFAPLSSTTRWRVNDTTQIHSSFSDVHRHVVTCSSTHKVSLVSTEDQFVTYVDCVQELTVCRRSRWNLKDRGS